MLRHALMGTLLLFATSVTLVPPVTAQMAESAGGSTMVGGGMGQTLRVVLTASDPSGAHCSALTEIATREGRVVARELVSLRPGESRFVQVDFGAVNRGRRVELLPAVKTIDGRCTAAVEIYENISGRTLAYMPGLLLPASDAPLAGIGVSLMQMVRLGVIREFDPQPDPPACRGVMAFADADGVPVGPSRPIDLEPGGTSILDLDPNLLLPAVSEPLRMRRFVRPQLLLPASGGGDTRGCQISVQLIDRLTGWTTVAVMAR